MEFFLSEEVAAVALGPRLPLLLATGLLTSGKATARNPPSETGKSGPTAAIKAE